MNPTGKITVQLGNYGKAHCYWAPCGNIPESNLKAFSPFLKVTKKDEEYELQIVLFAPVNYQLDPKNPIVMDYLRKDLFVFLNFKEEVGGPEDWQYFLIRMHFKESFSPKLRGKNVFVVPVHGDPEEGDVNKVVVEDEDEID